MKITNISVREKIDIITIIILDVCVQINFPYLNYVAWFL